MNNDVMQSIAIEAALNLLPPSMRKTLINDRSFLQEWNITTETAITFGKNGPTFRRDLFFEGIRTAIRNQGKTVPVEDQTDVTWNVLAQLYGETIEFSIHSGDNRYSISDHSALAEDLDTRVSWLKRVAKDIYFESSFYQTWLERLSSNPLSNEEFTDLVSNIQQTPISFYRNLQACLESGSVNLATLVPQELCYYERLVGKLGSCSKVEEYIEAGAKPLIKDLLEWNSTQGFLYALPVCSMGLIAKDVRIEGLGREELIQVYEWLAEHGDPISRVGAIEVALFHSDTHPELTPFIETIVKDLISDKTDNDSSMLMLLSSMIIIVASELARKGILRDTPPFYRKQAAIAQASLIVRAINESNIDPTSVTQWTRSLGIGHIFFLQGLIDLRCEPRWLPDFMCADQLRAEFIGRITNTANLREGKIKNDFLRALLLGPNSEIASAATWPFPNLPGPLEGAITPGIPVPEKVLNEVTKALEGDHLEANSFAGLVNTALLFDLPESQSSLAASALRRVKFSIENLDDKDTIFSLIAGLAVVAAVTRSTDLADALRILSRVVRRRQHLSSEPDEEMRIAMISAASFINLEDWARFLGEWIAEMAFEISDKDAAETLLLKLRRLMQLEPSLARHCAAADAALSTFRY
ncbi:hypothetical protein HOP61_02065 [Halomonas daqingensis]|uniref:GreAB-C-like domain-containing protein n=1 Tax=Billgrantia desiderata TaxID=52021 RepID=A0AAW4YPC0_9GAMM|nr:hypothetical protein [Halomonas desiderata]MCE8050082.1 hypothetical protein [Halomonas desiderata]